MVKKSSEKVITATIETKEGTFTGILLPDSSSKFIHLKLESGYNIKIPKKKIKKTRKSYKIVKKDINHIKMKSDLPSILILHTGGTIASKVDYLTGAVKPQFSAEELISMFPELQNLVSIKTKLLLQKFSEDISPKDWQTIAKEISKNLNKKYKGIIITHGTDTLHYTSAALSFMIQNPNLPILLVGAQRSSDRGSSDAYTNLICAVQFIVKSNFKGIGVCMHAHPDDDYCFIHSGVKVRKMHTSRRDAFQSVNSKPYAKVNAKGDITKLIDYPKSSKTLIDIKLNTKTALLKIYPGIPLGIFDKLKNFKGIAIEGTGLGHVDSKVMNKLKKLVKNSVIVMSSQCIAGRTNPNVYSTGRNLKKIGVIFAEDMLPEVAYIKLMWLLGHIKNKNKVKEEFTNNYLGEINKRLQSDDFLKDYDS